MTHTFDSSIAAAVGVLSAVMLADIDKVHRLRKARDPEKKPVFSHDEFVCPACYPYAQWDELERAWEILKEEKIIEQKGDNYSLTSLGARLLGYY
jgi:hypothetical protein